MGFADRLEENEQVDRVGRPLQQVASRLLGARRLRDVLSGRPLGHPAHPALVALPIGLWSSALLSDVIGERRAAQILTAAGVASVIPTAATGLSDWIDTEGAEQRIGALHLLANGTSTALFTASLVARARGRRWWGTALAGLGAAALGAGGWLGGHLAYALGVGVDTNAFEGGPTEWSALDELPHQPDDQVWAGRAAGIGLALVADPDRDVPRVLAKRCSHRGGPLSEGSLHGSCIECPWHRSRFDTRTGEVIQGPAVVDQPTYQVQRTGGGLEVRRDEPRALRTNSARE